MNIHHMVSDIGHRLYITEEYLCYAHKQDTQITFAFNGPQAYAQTVQLNFKHSHNAISTLEAFSEDLNADFCMIPCCSKMRSLILFRRDLVLARFLPTPRLGQSGYIKLYFGSHKCQIQFKSNDDRQSSWQWINELYKTNGDEQ